MKKLLTLFLLTSTIFGVSQNITNFIDPNGTWNVASTYPNANPENPSFVETTTKVYGFIGDTVIGSETWRKFYSTPDSSFFSDFTYLGNLIEENGIVQFMDTEGIIDAIYNFNLQIGDSVFYDFGFGTNYLHVENIDSIEISGEYFKKIHFEEPNYPPFFLNEIWIENIGSIHGPLFPKFPTVFSDEIPDSVKLTCYKIDNSIIWNNPDYDNCYINIVLNIKEINWYDFEIFPNPVKQKVSVRFPKNESENFTISIFDLFGKSIMNKTFIKQVLIDLDIGFLESSIYILQVESNNKFIRKKFIKQ